MSCYVRKPAENSGIKWHKESGRVCHKRVPRLNFAGDIPMWLFPSQPDICRSMSTSFWPDFIRRKVVLSTNPVRESKSSAPTSHANRQWKIRIAWNNSQIKQNMRAAVEKPCPLSQKHHEPMNSQSCKENSSGGWSGVQWTLFSKTTSFEQTAPTIQG